MKLDNTLIGYVTLFEQVTRVPVKDCFVDKRETLVFIVQDVYVGKAIGKQAVNLKKLFHLTKKKLKIIGYNANVCTFIKHILSPLKVDEITLENNIVTIKSSDVSVKAKIIGRNKENLNTLKELVKIYFPVDIVVA